MNILKRSRILIIAQTIAMMMVIAVLVGCDRNDQATDSTDEQTPASQAAERERTTERTADRTDGRATDRTSGQATGQAAGEQSPLEQVVESDGYTLRANVGRTDALPDAMARQYGIERDPDLVLLNVVVLEDRPDGQSAPVSAEISAQVESLSGHVESIDMQEAESNGHVSYIGTLDASTQREFQLHIEAQPSGTDQSLHMEFDVKLEAFETSGSE